MSVEKSVLINWGAAAAYKKCVRECLGENLIQSDRLPQPLQPFIDQIERVKSWEAIKASKLTFLTFLYQYGLCLLGDPGVKDKYPLPDHAKGEEARKAAGRRFLERVLKNAEKLPQDAEIQQLKKICAKKAEEYAGDSKSNPPPLPEQKPVGPTSVPAAQGASLPPSSSRASTSSPTAPFPSSSFFSSSEPPPVARKRPPPSRKDEKEEKLAAGEEKGFQEGQKLVREARLRKTILDNAYAIPRNDVGVGRIIDDWCRKRQGDRVGILVREGGNLFLCHRNLTTGVIETDLVNMHLLEVCSPPQPLLEFFKQQPPLKLVKLLRGGSSSALLPPEKLEEEIAAQKNLCISFPEISDSPWAELVQDPPGTYTVVKGMNSAFDVRASSQHLPDQDFPFFAETFFKVVNALDIQTLVMPEGSWSTEANWQIIVGKNRKGIKKHLKDGVMLAMKNFDPEKRSRPGDAYYRAGYNEKIVSICGMIREACRQAKSYPEQQARAKAEAKQREAEDESFYGGKMNLALYLSYPRHIPVTTTLIRRALGKWQTNIPESAPLEHYFDQIFSAVIYDRNLRKEMEEQVSKVTPPEIIFKIPRTQIHWFEDPENWKKIIEANWKDNKLGIALIFSADSHIAEADPCLVAINRRNADVRNILQAGGEFPWHYWNYVIQPKIDERMQPRLTAEWKTLRKELVKIYPYLRWNFSDGSSGYHFYASFNNPNARNCREEVRFLRRKLREQGYEFLDTAIYSQLEGLSYSQRPVIYVQASQITPPAPTPTPGVTGQL